MANTRRLFDKTEVARYFKESEFNQIPVKKLIALVIDIRQHEEDILEVWERHLQGKEFPGFQLKGVAYAITKSMNYDYERPYYIKKLWVEQVV